jgi:hypothetical protein
LVRDCFVFLTSFLDFPPSRVKLLANLVQRVFAACHFGDATSLELVPLSGELVVKGHALLFGCLPRFYHRTLGRFSGLPRLVNQTLSRFGCLSRLGRRPFACCTSAAARTMSACVAVNSASS